MLLSSVILILQEILEASLVLSVLLAFSVHNRLSRLWAFAAIGLGIIAACLYASQAGAISEWFDYVGLEVVNSTIQWTISLALLAFAAIYSFARRNPVSPLVWYGLMVGVVTLTIAREGFEILLYGMNFIGDDKLWTPVLSGGLLGAGIGISAGALLYYGLTSLPASTGARLLLALLALFSGNMASQGTLLLIQADWLPSGRALWDTNFLIPENSLLGQLLYALIGYEASPTALQVGAYILLVALVAISFNLRRIAPQEGA